MKFPRLPLLLAAALTLATGCASQRFTRLRVTDHHGAVLAEWVARGFIRRSEQGYRITAVERVSGPPFAIVSRYPEGWRTTVTGPHILHWRSGKPLWLYELEDR